MELGFFSVKLEVTKTQLSLASLVVNVSALDHVEPSALTKKCNKSGYQQQNVQKPETGSMFPLGYEQILFYMETFRSGWSGMVRSTGKRSF